MVDSSEFRGIERRGSLGRFADDENFVDVRLHFTVDRAINRLPGERAGINLLEDVSGCRFPAIGEHAGLLHDPAITLVLPLAIGIAAVGIEDPRTYLFGDRIPIHDCPADTSRY